MTALNLCFDHVTYRYSHGGNDAVVDVSLCVNAGEVVLVTGVSGCGKTTLMRLANGLAPQVYGGFLSGSITLGDIDVSTTPVAVLSEMIGTLFQDPEDQFFALNVKDEIAFALRSRGVPTGEIEERVQSAAQTLGLTAYLSRDIHTLSEGQKQKVGLASLLALGPQVFIFDEPSANLDPESTRALAQTIAELKRRGSAVLVVDHRLYWLRDVADRVCVMRRGRIVESGPMSLLEDSALRERWGLRAFDVPDPRETLAKVPVVRESSLYALGQPMQKEAAFSTRGLCFAYEGADPIFDGVSFSVNDGITALVGDNGTGKTTLARILTGLNRANGALFLRGVDVSETSLMSQAGLVLQNADHQLQMRTVLEEVLTARLAARTVELEKEGFFSRLRRPKLTDADRGEVEELLERLNLTHLAHRHPQSLSGGEKQRLVIACAVIKNPSLVILDEPTSGLDGANMQAIAQVLKAEAARGRAVFLITHDLELLGLCDRALMMSDMKPQSI